jgi:hypothetical protein
VIREQVTGVGTEVAEEAVASPAREGPGLAQVHRTEVVADEALHDPSHPLGEPPALADQTGTLRPDHVVVEEPDTPLHHPGRLGLGHVVEKRRQLEALDPGDAAPEGLGEMRREFLGERREGAELCRDGIRASESADRMLQHAKAVRPRLAPPAHRFDLGQDDGQDPERVRAPHRARGGRQS